MKMLKNWGDVVIPFSSSDQVGVLCFVRTKFKVQFIEKWF